MTFQVFNALKLDKIAKSVCHRWWLHASKLRSKLFIAYLYHPSVTDIKDTTVTVKRFYPQSQLYHRENVRCVTATMILPCIKLFNVSNDDAMPLISQRIVVIHRCTSYLLLIPVTVNTYVLSLSLPTPMFLSLPTTVHTHAFVTVNIYFCHWQ